MKNCKVIPGETCLTQHRLLWAEVVIRRREKKGFGRGEKRKLKLGRKIILSKEEYLKRE